MSVVTLKPGLLVSLHTSISGGVQYQRRDLAAGDAKTSAPEGAAVAKWETTKITDDSELYERAVKVRGKCSSLVRGACAHSNFGLLCPAAREGDLDQAISDAESVADRFNQEHAGRGIRVGFFVLRGRIAESEGEAARAIASDMRELLAGMRAGIDEQDVKKIRDAASRAKRVGAMLDGEAAKKVSAAIDEARAVARDIVKKIAEKASDVAAYVQTVKVAALDEARFAFLDMDEAPAERAALPLESRAVDLGVDEDAAAGEEELERAADAEQAFAAPALEV